MKKLLIYPNGADQGEGVYYLMSEDGEVLASHFCSHAGFAKIDLESGRPERQKKWKERFGEYEVMFYSEAGLTKEEISKRNHEWYEANKPKEEIVK